MDLLDLLANIKKEVGQDAAEVEKSLENAKELYNKRLTNDPNNTATTGWGKELVPRDTLLGTILTMPGNEPSFLSALPGFHGFNMGISEKLSIKGALPRAIGNTERITGAAAVGAGKRIATGEVTIKQVPLLIQIDISKRHTTYSVDNLMDYVTSEIAKSVAADTEYVILNADPKDDATGNINCNDAQPSVTFADGAKDIRLMFDTSIRKNLISNSLTVNVGTLEWAHFIAVRQKLGKFATRLSDLMLIMDSICYHKALTLNDFKKANENGRSSTISTGAISNIAGVDLYVPGHFPATESNGTVSATAANNTKGGFLYLYKPAVQYGFGQDLEIEIYKIPGQGHSILGTYEFGFAIVNQKAGETDNWMYGGINVTTLTVGS